MAHALALGTNMPPPTKLRGLNEDWALICIGAKTATLRYFQDATSEDPDMAFRVFVNDPGYVALESLQASDLERWMIDNYRYREFDVSGSGSAIPEEAQIYVDPYSELAIPEADVEAAIERIADKFGQALWLHRAEHSIHMELAIELNQIVNKKPETLISEQRVARVQKEWPSLPIPSQDEDGKPVLRRGNHDLVMLGEAYPNSNWDQLVNGTAYPEVIVEVGLDYGLKHLGRDLYKLSLYQDRKIQLVAVHLTRRKQQPVINYLNEPRVRNNGASIAVYYFDGEDRKVIKQSLPIYSVLYEQFVK